MTWQIKVLDEFEREFLNKIVDELCDRLEEDNTPHDDEDAIREACYDNVGEVIDGWFIYNEDQLAALQYYGHINDGMDAAWGDIESDVVERAVNNYWK